jgi:twitching motility protein PilT
MNLKFVFMRLNLDSSGEVFIVRSLVRYLKEVVERGGSDLHISVNSPPVMRLYGDLMPIEKLLLSSDETFRMFEEILDDYQLEELERLKSIDLAFEIPHAGHYQRFRCNLFMQKEGVDGTFRVISRNIPSLKELNLPTHLEDLALYKDGLILVTGPTGSGKSTTTSSLIEIINNTQATHIITIEDPIEYIHKNKHSIIQQRQLNLHTLSFGRAMETALRSDPDIIMISELRDLETIDIVLTAASTGQLVISTMHTASTAKAIERLIEFYPIQRHQTVRSLLADSIRAIIAQQLIPRADGWGRIPAVEILINCMPIANLIRESRTHQVTSIIQTSRNLGMISMDDYLVKLYEQKKITAVAAYEYAVDKRSFESILRSG